MGVAHWYDERERGDIYTNTDTNMNVTIKIYNSCKAILNTVYQIETIYQSTQDSQKWPIMTFQLQDDKLQ